MNENLNKKLRTPRTILLGIIILMIFVLTTLAMISSSDIMLLGGIILYGIFPLLISYFFIFSHPLISGWLLLGIGIIPIFSLFYSFDVLFTSPFSFIVITLFFIHGAIGLWILVLCCHKTSDPLE